MAPLVEDDALEVFHDVLVSDGLALPFVFPDRGLLAHDGVFHHRPDFPWILVIGRRPIGLPPVPFTPKAGVQPHLTGKLRKDVQMVHLDDADDMEALGELGVLCVEDHAVVKIQADRAHFGVVASDIAEHGACVRRIAAFRPDRRVRLVDGHITEVIRFCIRARFLHGNPSPVRGVRGADATVLYELEEGVMTEWKTEKT